MVLTNSNEYARVGRVFSSGRTLIHRCKPGVLGVGLSFKEVRSIGIVAVVCNVFERGYISNSEVITSRKSPTELTFWIMCDYCELGGATGCSISRTPASIYNEATDFMLGTDLQMLWGRNGTMVKARDQHFSDAVTLSQRSAVSTRTTILKIERHHSNSTPTSCSRHDFVEKVEAFSILSTMFPTYRDYIYLCKVCLVRTND